MRQVPNRGTVESSARVTPVMQLAEMGILHLLTYLAQTKLLSAPLSRSAVILFAWVLSPILICNLSGALSLWTFLKVIRGASSQTLCVDSIIRGSFAFRLREELGSTSSGNPFWYVATRVRFFNSLDQGASGRSGRRKAMPVLGSCS